MIKLLSLSLFVISVITCGNQQKKDFIKLNASTISLDSIVKNKFKALKLKVRFQSNYPTLNTDFDRYDVAVSSPKSIIFSADGKKFYVNSLEGYTTIVYDAKRLVKLKEIKHVFDATNNSLFLRNESTVFGYEFRQKQQNFNYFMGKPVESCLSHNGKYLWVTYYRRDWDENASSPSAVAIIDTSTDQIVRVMPTGPLPKMIACSPNNKYIAVTHWGDNTVGIIDVSSQDVEGFSYKTKIVIDNQLSLNYDDNQKIDRDNECGNCLRGTIFTPNSKTLLVAKMGGNGIAKIDTKNFKYVGTYTGMKGNIRHLVINNNNLMVSSNKFGFVQKIKLDSMLSISDVKETQLMNTKNWKTAFVGIGARTIDVSADGKYIFACVNNENKISVIDSKTMQVIYSIEASKYPVGMALSPDGKTLIVTSQGKTNQEFTGNVVAVYDVIFE